MGKKKHLILYTCIWGIALLILMVSLFESTGDARIINYSGIVRGATQKLVKEELSGQADDFLIEKLDAIIDNLKTGKGDYNLHKCNYRRYQDQLHELENKWRDIKGQIILVRQERLQNENGMQETKRLYDFSQEHFVIADELVKIAEDYSRFKLWGAIIFLAVYLAVTIASFLIFYRRNRADLEHSLVTDVLTGLSNRYGFELKVAEILKSHTSCDYVMIQIDIDDFKWINGTYGYELGDSLLCAISAALNRFYFEGEAAARISSDDFMILAKNRDNLIDDLRNKLSEAVKESLKLDLSGTLTFTVGAYNVKAGENIKKMIAYTGIAHKNAKANGKSSTVWYNEELLNKLSLENKLTAGMRRGLDKNEFKLYLQPKFDMRDMRLIGAEALVRWEVGPAELLFPDSFIPLFEKNGTISELDFYMLDKACAHISKELRKERLPVPISVNFSRLTIYAKDFPERFLQIINRYGIPANLIEIEITEGAFNGLAETILAMLNNLRSKGFMISMDDFGSGYSSLNLLNTLKVDTLKLDREFLRTFSGPSALTVRSIINCVVELARALNITVICEGVETEEQMAFLKTIRCHFGQGYFFSKPLSEDMFIDKYYGEGESNLLI